MAQKNYSIVEATLSGRPFRAATMNTNYWIKVEGDKLVWDSTDTDVNINVWLLTTRFVLKSVAVTEEQELTTV